VQHTIGVVQQMGDKQKRGGRVTTYCQVMWQVVSTCSSCSFLCCFSHTQHSHHAHVIPILKVVLYLGVSYLSRFTLKGKRIRSVCNKEGTLRVLMRVPLQCTRSVRSHAKNLSDTQGYWYLDRHSLCVGGNVVEERLGRNDAW
jgi:hypothetical protein